MHAHELAHTNMDMHALTGTEEEGLSSKVGHWCKVHVQSKLTHSHAHIHVVRGRKVD